MGLGQSFAGVGVGWGGGRHHSTHYRLGRKAHPQFGQSGWAVGQSPGLWIEEREDLADPIQCHRPDTADRSKPGMGSVCQETQSGGGQNLLASIPQPTRSLPLPQPSTLLSLVFFLQLAKPTGLCTCSLSLVCSCPRSSQVSSRPQRKLPPTAPASVPPQPL